MRQPLATLLAAFAMTAAPATALAQAAPASDGTLLSVSSRAEARKAPDIATFSAGVVTQAADGNAAMGQNAGGLYSAWAAANNDYIEFVHIFLRHAFCCPGLQ